MPSIAKSALAAAAIVLTPLSYGVLAQERPRDQPQGWSVTVGAATIYAPSYLGDDDYALLLLPSIRIAYADTFFASVEGGVGYNAINQGGWKIGPIARYDFGRREDDDNPFRIAGAKSDDLRGLGDIDGTFELGGFAQYEYQNLSATIELRQGLNGHEGLVGAAQLRYSDIITGFGPPVILSVGPSLKFAAARFLDTYFGIDAQQSAGSGLVQYNAGGGLVSYGVSGVAIVPLTAQISLTAFAGYDRLAKAAANSPLVKSRGSRHQAVSGIAVGYRF